MADVANSTVTAEGLFKKLYGDKLERLIPSSVEVAKRIPFVPQNKRQGESYNMAVNLTREHGWTLEDGSTNPFTKPDSKASVTKQASVKGSQFLEKSTISYLAMSQANTTNGISERAFAMASSYVVESMLETAAFVRELVLMYGGGQGAEAANVGGIGLIASATGSGPYEVVLTEASWASGIWAGAEGMKVDVYDTTLANDKGNFEVTAVSIENRTLELTGSISGSFAANDVIYLNNGYQNEAAGLKRSITNTGTLHTISAATYNLWGGNSFLAGGAAFTFQKLLSALNRSVSRGLRGKVCALISVATFSDMLNDLSALRRYVQDTGGKLTQGAQSLEYHYQGGMVEVVPHIFMKNGEAAFLPDNCAVRIGSTDITFKIPGGMDRFLEDDPSVSAYRMQCYWHQGLLVKHPAKCTWVTGIVNSTTA